MSLDPLLGQASAPGRSRLCGRGGERRALEPPLELDLHEQVGRQGAERCQVDFGRRLREGPGEHLGDGGDGRAVVLPHRIDFPQARVERTTQPRVDLALIKRVVCGGDVRVKRTVDEHAHGRLTQQKVIHEAERERGAARRGPQRDPAQPLGEGGRQIELSGKAAALSSGESRGCDEGVQLAVKVGVLEVVLLHQDEEAPERQQRLDPATTVPVGQQVAESKGSRHVRQDGVRECREHPPVGLPGEGQLQHGAPSVAELLLVPPALKQASGRRGPATGFPPVGGSRWDEEERLRWSHVDRGRRDLRHELNEALRPRGARRASARSRPGKPLHVPHQVKGDVQIRRVGVAEAAEN
eukprot:scaffold10870_cov117-Isochrysis_galbana.AAC.3